MILLDSSFLVAFHNKRDAHHEAAAGLMSAIIGGKWGRAILLEYVFLEVVTVLAARLNIEAAVEVGTVLLDAAEVDFLPCADFFPETWDSFGNQTSGDLSFTDAAIVTVAQQNTPCCIATFDRDFQGIDGVALVPG